MEFCCKNGYNHDLIILCHVMPYFIAGLDYSISGNVVSVSGYPCSEHMDEDYVLMVFEALDDRARLV
jgi:hypothetical protein